MVTTIRSNPLCIWVQKKLVSSKHSILMTIWNWFPMSNLKLNIVFILKKTVKMFWPCKICLGLTWVICLTLTLLVKKKRFKFLWNQRAVRLTSWLFYILTGQTLIMTSMRRETLICMTLRIEESNWKIYKTLLNELVWCWLIIVESYPKNQGSKIIFVLAYWL